MDHELPTLTDGTVTLRPPVPADVAARFVLGRDDVVLAGYGRQAADLPAWKEEAAQDWVDEKTRLGFWIIDAFGDLCGAIGFQLHNTYDARAMISIGLLSAERLGQGIGHRALSLALEHGFGAMGLHRVALRVMADNTRAIRCYERLGFIEEGREREAGLTPSGDRVDDIIMGLLAYEWRVAA